MASKDTWLIVSDFDETFMPVLSSREADAGIEKLESCLNQLKREHHLLFGWATGNSQTVVLDKMKRYPGFPWDFALTSLGTELYWNHPDSVLEDEGWPLQGAGAFPERVIRLNALFEREGIELTLQSEAFQQKRIRGYYLKADGNEAMAIEHIHKLCLQVGLEASITYASAAAGDPENVYDVAVMHPGCGKKQGVEFIVKKHGISPARVISFGDSCNDIEMLKASSYGYLVGNASVEARQAFDRVVKGFYCHGIVDGLQRHF